MTQPCGTWKITDIPEAEVGGVMGNFALDGPKSIEKTPQPNGKWTVTAVFEDCPPGQPNSTHASHGA